MNKLHKTLLLLGLQQQCRADREMDWQSLHRRDREWFLAQGSQNRWQLARHWLGEFAEAPPWHGALSPWTVGLLGLLLGIGLMSGLLQFQPQQRINLWWWLLLTVWLPALWWLLGLWLSRSAATGLWARALLGRLPAHWQKDIDRPLLARTAQAISQQFSLAFALGLVGTFFAYLLLTDLAFGWSSTLDVSAAGVYRLTQALAWPWHALWPEAVPSLQLVEQTRFFRVDESAALEGQQLGQWWRFLLMNLLSYVLLPRVLSFAWAEWQLGRAQQRLFTQDACIDGWWQRMHFEQVRQQAAPLAQPHVAPTGADSGGRTRAPAPQQAADHWPLLHAIVAAGHWPPEQLAASIARLPAPVRALPLLAIEQVSADSRPGQALLLLCKGWEPPTGALLDLCQQMHAQQQQLYLWPVPLAGMKAGRARQLRASWQLFMPQLPASCHLLEPESDA